MKTILKKIIIAVLMGALVIAPTTSSKGISIEVIQAIIKVVKKIIKYETKLEQANQVKSLLEDIICAKYKYDIYKKNIAFQSCMMKSQFKVLDIEMSSVVKELIAFLNNDDEKIDKDMKFSDIIKKLQNIIDEIKTFNQLSESAIVSEQKDEGQLEFSKAVISRSF